MILVIDNYDSFTWNLVQLLGELGAESVVRRNDEITLAGVEALDPERIVVSPGPCTPRDAGISVEAVRRFAPRVPILGVCLGHQCIGEAFGARTVRASRPMHGKVCGVRHSGAGLFAGLPDPLRVTRYHSLELEPDSIPADLVVHAWVDAPGPAEVQAVSHRELPVWGVQFHPESLATERGADLFANFLAIR